MFVALVYVMVPSWNRQTEPVDVVVRSVVGSPSWDESADYRFYASLPNGRTSRTVLVQAR